MLLRNGRLAKLGLLVICCCFYCMGCRTTGSQFTSNSRLNETIASQSTTVIEANNQTDSQVEVAKEESAGKETKAITLTASSEMVISNDGFSLEEIERLALQNNPSIRQAEAAVSKAVGIRHQVQLYPNPVMGYNGTQLADEQTDQHTLFVEQEFVTSNKLEKNAQVLDHEVQNLKWQVEQQRRTVIADVKQYYYEVLGAQKQLNLSNEFTEIALKSVDITKQLKMIGEGTNVDILQSEIQLQQLLISQKQAQATLQGAWKKLTATIGLPEMDQQEILGELPTQPLQYYWDDEYARILKDSPELKAAHYRVTRGLAMMDRQHVQANPNVSVSLAAGYDRATNSQMINTQVGMPIPFYNQNEGNQSAAYADYCHATQELKRIELSLKARLAQTAQDYESAAAAVNMHRDEVVPKAQELLKLAELSYKTGEVNFLQVLVIRKTYYDTMNAYITARSSLAKAQVSIEEYLLSGSLESKSDSGYDDGLRSQALSGQ